MFTNLSYIIPESLSQKILLILLAESITLFMCYLVIEKYAVCKCVYYVHSIDMCAAYGTPGHKVEERIMWVGYACDRHWPPES